MKRELIVTAGGQDHSVVLEGPLPGEPNRFRVQIDGRSPASGNTIDGRSPASGDPIKTERVVDARAVRPGTWSIVIDGRSFVVDLDPRRGGLAASVGASEVTLQVADALQRRLADATQARAGGARGETIRAPIAGKVVKLLVAVDDQVEPGTPVIVLEAMKMENELVAERGGKVTAIHKQPGQPVDTNDALVELA